jgi:putative transposase
MGRPRKKLVSEGKAKLIEQLMAEYDIETPQNIEAALRDLLGGTIQNMMESEIEEQMVQTQKANPEYTDSRNGYKPKTLKSNYGEVPIRVPQDRNSDFEPKVVPKHQRDISEIEDKIISMYAKGMSTRQISDQIQDIYGFDVSESLVTGITNKIIPEIEEWQKRPLAPVYPIVFIDAIVFNVRDNGVIKKQAAYIILGISEEGHKEVLTITIGETESSKYWLSVLNKLKNRGVQDILILCADGLAGIKEAIEAAYPLTEYQRCIVHVVRNTLNMCRTKTKKHLQQI